MSARLWGAARILSSVRKKKPTSAISYSVCNLFVLYDRIRKSAYAMMSLKFWVSFLTLINIVQIFLTFLHRSCLQNNFRSCQGDKRYYPSQYPSPLPISALIQSQNFNNGIKFELCSKMLIYWTFFIHSSYITLCVCFFGEKENY